MQKPKLLDKNQNRLSLKDFLDTYPAITLHSALNTLDNSDGWKLFEAYSRFIQRRYEVDSLDMVAKGETHQASYASGYAKAVSDLVESFIPGLRETILGKTSYENPRPEE